MASKTKGDGTFALFHTVKGDLRPWVQSTGLFRTTWTGDKARAMRFTSEDDAATAMPRSLFSGMVKVVPHPVPVVTANPKPAKRTAPRLGTKANPKPWADIPQRDRDDAIGVIEECAKAAWGMGHQGASRAIQSALDVLRKAPVTKGAT